MGCLTVIYERIGGGDVTFESKGGVDATFEKRGGINAWYSQVCEVPVAGLRFCASDGAFLTREGYSIIVKAQ